MMRLRQHGLRDVRWIAAALVLLLLCVLQGLQWHALQHDLRPAAASASDSGDLPDTSPGSEHAGGACALCLAFSGLDHWLPSLPGSDGSRVDTPLQYVAGITPVFGVLSLFQPGRGPPR